MLNLSHPKCLSTLLAQAGFTNSQLDSQKNTPKKHSKTSPSISFGLSIDTLTAVIPCHYEHNARSILSFVSQFLDESCEVVRNVYQRVAPGFHANNCARFPSGAQAQYSLANERGNSSQMRLNLPGASLQGKSFDVVWAFCEHLRTFGLEGIPSANIPPVPVKFTRVDIAFDDYSRSCPFKKMIQALYSGNYSIIREFLPQVIFGQKYKGFTFYLGSKKSNKYVRIYDKRYESGGKIDSLRIEGQYRGDHADKILSSDVFAATDSDSESIQKYLLSVLFGSFDFVDRESKGGDRQKNLDRCPRFSWWQKFLDLVGSTPINVVIPRQPKPLYKTLEWFHRQVAPTVAAVNVYLGDVGRDYLDHIVGEAKDRIPKGKRLQLETLNRYLDEGKASFQDILYMST